MAIEGLFINGQGTRIPVPVQVTVDGRLVVAATAVGDFTFTPTAAGVMSKAATPAAQAAAPTAANVAALTSADAVAIANLRTRLAEVENALIAYGWMAARP
jgi:ribosomal protein L11